MSTFGDVKRAIEAIRELEKPPIINVTGLAESGEAFLTMLPGERRRIFLSPGDAKRLGVTDGEELDIEELRRRFEEDA